MNLLDELPLEAGAFCMMDRGYIDFNRLRAFTEAGAFFVVRAKRNLSYRRSVCRVVDKSMGLRCDQTILLAGVETAKDYPAPLRRISYVDAETGKRFVFLTKNFPLEDIVIPQLYKRRWRVELFFKWIKQYLRIKAFYGAFENAVKTQTWVAIAVYVLVAIMKKKMGLKRSLCEILQFCSISLFEKVEFYQALTKISIQDETLGFRNQSNLFDF